MKGLNFPSEPTRWCGVGDAIEGDLGGRIGRGRVVLKTPEGAAFANELILTGRWEKTAEATR